MHYNPNTHHRRSIRLKGYDYSQAGLYFVTICTRNREHLFGKIKNGKMILNEYGKIAHDEWLNTPNIRPNVELGEFVVMPNHIHGIIIIANDGINAHRSGGVLHTPPQTIVSNDNRGVCNTPLRSPSQTTGAIIRGYKTAVSKQLNQFKCFGTIWQRNYFETIIRNDHSHQHIANYIIRNPITWENDRYK